MGRVAALALLGVVGQSGAILAHSALAAAAPQPPTSWTCRTLNASTIGSSVAWRRLNCTSSAIPVYGPAGPVVINVAEVSLDAPGVRLLPVAAPAGEVQTLDLIAAATPTCVAAINSVYFWRLDSKSFIDDVCLGKSRADALKPVAPGAASANFGVGDGAMVANGQLLSSTCNTKLFQTRPVTLTINGTASRFDVQHTGDTPPAGLALDSVTVGPNLLSSNASGTFVDIPDDDLNIGNILEHSANTGVGLTADGRALFVTTDGRDACPFYDQSCGTNAFTLAYFFRDYLNATSAMAMDQGGSTTMWLKGPGIISSPGGSPRSIFGGLCIVED